MSHPIDILTIPESTYSPMDGSYLRITICNQHSQYSYPLYHIVYNHHVYIYIYVHTYSYIHTYMFMFVYIYVYIYIYIRSISQNSDICDRN